MQLGKGFKIPIFNSYLKNLSDEITEACNSYLILFENLEKPGFLLTCLEPNAALHENHNLSELMSYIGGHTYFSFFPQDLIFMLDRHLFNALSQHREANNQLLKVIEILLCQQALPHTINTLLDKMVKEKEIQQDYFGYIRAYLKPTLEIEAQTDVLAEWLSKLRNSLLIRQNEIDVYLSFAEKLDSRLIKLIHETSGKRNKLFLDKIWKKWHQSRWSLFKIFG